MNGEDKMNKLMRLADYGQSYWLDNLTREMLATGELKRRAHEEGLRGVTSNPKIFMKAISGSDRYEQPFRRLAAEGRDLKAIYEELAVADVRDACDVLRATYDRTEGRDGFVSLEVSPYLAHDTEGTMNEVRRLFAAVDRPNVMIKIPGTLAGVPAIEEMLYAGININITLLFSVKRYEAVADAYLRALERRVDESKPIDGLASVASFFLSRIDVLTDRLLGHRFSPARARENAGRDEPRPRAEELLGKVAIANAKMAYQSFKRIFAGSRWQALENRGARVQRLLWASTSTKDPLYRDVRYVEPLIGRQTVNTMPEKTIRAFADHGELRADTLEEEVGEAQHTLDHLKRVGLNLDDLTWQLENEGIQKFIAPFDELMAVLAEKRRDAVEALPPKMSTALVGLDHPLSEALAALDQRQWSRRLFEKDPWLWASEPHELQSILDRLGWIDCIDAFRENVPDLFLFAEEVKERFRHVVLLGMGGSSLCAEVCRQTFGSRPGWPELLVLDDVDPAAIAGVEKHVDLSKTLFLVASKSGTTVETLSLYRYFYEKAREELGESFSQNFVAITDSGTPLLEEARSLGFRRFFENPHDVGGRYSALSYFGLVPMALMGIDIESLLSRADRVRRAGGPYVPSKASPAVKLGTLLGVAARGGRDKVTFVAGGGVDTFALWAEQLLAESTGKKGTGMIPVVDEPLGTPEGYGADRIFIRVFTGERSKDGVAKRLAALEASGHPVVRIQLDESLDLGAEFYRWEIAAATAGALLGINPFDEPNVGESKRNTSLLLEEWKERRGFVEQEPLATTKHLEIRADPGQTWLRGFKRHAPIAQVMETFLGLARSGDYLALLPYFQLSGTRRAQLEALRLALRDRLKIATTLGQGPRYLHSTGQLHKGGPANGIYVLLTADPPASERPHRPIPKEPFDFATLQRAQALGDFRALNDKGRRALRVHLRDDVGVGLGEILQALVSEAKLARAKA